MNKDLNNAIINLPQLVQEAREKSLIGLYEESLETYKKVLKLINDRMNQVTDHSLKESWNITGHNLKQEYNELKEILERCNTFKMEKQEFLQKRREENPMILRDYFDNDRKQNQDRPENPLHDQEENPREKRFERFGGRLPFQHHEEDKNLEDPKAKKHSPHVKNSKNNLDKIDRISKQVSNPKEPKRNYEKPWLNDDPPKDAKKKKKEEKNSNKSYGLLL